MKGAEIDGAVRRFQKAVDAWAELERDLAQAERSLAEARERYPALARAHRLFGRVLDRLEVIGAAVADVPGLAGELQEEQARLARLRKLAARHGISVRYDGG